MRTPSSAFVLFQFAGEHKGRVMFRPGPTKDARVNFAELIKRLDSVLVGDCWGGRVTRNGSGKVLKSKESFVALWFRDGRIETWTGLAESELSDLCRDFGDWLANAGIRPGVIKIP